MRHQIFHTIAADLERRVRTDPAFALPSIYELAQSYDVAYKTMWKAVRELAEKGVVRTRHGMKTRRAIGEGADAPVLSSDKICDAIAHSIETGTYRAGSVLPKLDSFALSHNVSNSTVTRALRRCASRRLVHRHRRRWVAGPAPVRRGMRQARSAAIDMPAVVILYNDATAWTYDIGVTFVSAFMTPFASELLSHGVLVSPCLRRAGNQQGLAVPAGMDQVMAFIRSLGERYVGAIALSSHPKEDGLEEWIPALLRRGKPALYFDQADAGGHCTRQFFSAKKGYYRLHQDEKSAVMLAVAYLARAGHRSIAIHGADVDALWAQRRARSFRDIGATMTPALRVQVSGANDPLWKISDWTKQPLVSRIAGQLGMDEPFHDGDQAKLEGFRRVLIERAGSLVSLLAESKATALACLNDYMAREYFFWLRAMGVDIPRDLSLISFDNSPESTFFPVSTVDWGFERLGYLAAHVLIGDIPVRADRFGNIAGVCRLADRGSIGKPGDPEMIKRHFAV